MKHRFDQTDYLKQRIAALEAEVQMYKQLYPGVIKANLKPTELKDEVEFKKKYELCFQPMGLAHK